MKLEPDHLRAELDRLANTVTGVLHMLDWQLADEYRDAVGDPPNLDRTFLMHSLIQLQVTRIRTMFELDQQE